MFENLDRSLRLDPAAQAREIAAAADIRDGTVNANGPVYGVAEMTDMRITAVLDGDLPVDDHTGPAGLP